MPDVRSCTERNGIPATRCYMELHEHGCTEYRLQMVAHQMCNIPCLNDSGYFDAIESPKNSDFDIKDLMKSTCLDGHRPPNKYLK